MSGAILFSGTDIQHRYLSAPCALQKSPRVDRFHTLLTRLELPDDALNLCQPILSQAAENAVEITDLLAGEAVGHKKALLLALNQSRGMKNPQMLRRIGNTQAGFARQGFHGSRRLAQQVEQFQSGWTGDRFADPAELFIEGFPRGRCGHVWFYCTAVGQVFNQAVEYMDSICCKGISRLSPRYRN
jgi:hypothetical protein